MSWQIRRRNGGVDINAEMGDAPYLWDYYGEWVSVVALEDIRARLDVYLKDFDCEVLSDRERRMVIQEILEPFDEA